jgi:hypothetical protein
MKLQIHLTNFEKKLGVFTVMLATITALWYFDRELYDIIFINLGVWFTSSQIGTWARARWPKEVKEEPCYSPRAGGLPPK